MKYWNNLSLQLKLQLAIVVFMVITLLFGQFWIQKRFEKQARKQAETTIIDNANLIGNALTTMMVTGVVSERIVFLKELENLPNIEEIHIARNRKVIDQYGVGEGSEGTSDSYEKEVMRTGKTLFVQGEKNGKPILKGIVPLIATENTFGKNCLECHDVPSGYVNGTISVSINLDEVDGLIHGTEVLLWYGQIGWQVLLFLIIMFIMQVLLTKPIHKVKETIKHIAQDNDLTLKVTYQNNDELGQIATQLNQLLERLQQDFIRIGTDADNVSKLSKTLKNSSEHINERSILQESKLTDIVAAVDEITRTTAMVADNTSEAASLSEDASQAALKGGDIIS